MAVRRFLVVVVFVVSFVFRRLLQVADTLERAHAQRNHAYREQSRQRIRQPEPAQLAFGLLQGLLRLMVCIFRGYSQS